MEIRRATIEDFDQLTGIKLAAKVEECSYNEALRPIEETREKYCDYLRSDLSDEDRAVFIAVEGHEVVGMVTGRIYTTLPIRRLPRRGHISNVFIAPDHRKEGLAGRLIEEVLNWFKERDTKDIRLEVHFRNHAALGLFKTIGFDEFAVELKKSL